MTDIISNGRVDFGIGKGSEPVEYRRSGVRQEEATGRTKEGTEIICQAWSDGPVNFHGDFFHYDNVRVLPKPVQRPRPPIWVGATRNEDTFRWAGEKGFNLMTIPFVHPTVEAVHGLVKIYRGEHGRAGHDLAAKEILGKFHIYLSDSFERAVREATPYMENYHAAHAAADPVRKLSRHDLASDMARGFIIVGDAQRCIDTIRRWREEGGLTTFSFTFHFGGMPQELPSKHPVVAEQVMPAFEGLIGGFLTSLGQFPNFGFLGFLGRSTHHEERSSRSYWGATRSLLVNPIDEPFLLQLHRCYRRQRRLP